MISYAHDNLLFGANGERGALFRVNTVSYPYLSDRDKEGWLGRMAMFAYRLETDFSIYRVCRTYDKGDYFAPEVYLIVKLMADPELSGHFFERLARKISALSGSARPRGLKIGEAEIELLQAEKARVLGNASTMLPLRDATTRELQWLVRRLGCRGVREPELDNYWKPAAIRIADEDRASFKPLKTTFTKFLEPPEETSLGLVFENEYGTSHQSNLALGALPEEAGNPKGVPVEAEVIGTPLLSLGFPVDVVSHVRVIPNKEASNRVRSKTRGADVAHSEESAQEFGVLVGEARDAAITGRNALLYLKDTSAPLLIASTTLTVWGDTEEERDKRVDLLRRAYGHVQLYRPRHKQAIMYRDQLPRLDGGVNHDYDEPITKEQFGAMAWLAAHDAGSSSGPKIGRTTLGGRRPIHLDTKEASQINRTSTILMAGSLGSGKTVAGEFIAREGIRQGHRVVTVDPKPDHRLEYLPELKGKVDLIEINGSDDRYAGLLDPMIVAPQGLGRDMAYSYLMNLLPLNAPAEWGTSILEAIDRVEDSKDAGLLLVLDELLNANDPMANTVGRALRARANTGLARLGFGPNPNASLYANNLVTTIRPSGLSLPDSDSSPSDYTEMERLSVATIQLVAAYAMRLLHGDRSHHKLWIMDEAWFLLTTRDGVRLLKRMATMSRALNVSLILLTQRLVHVGDVENLAGVRFMFGQETDHDAKIALSLIGLDPDDDRLVREIRSMREGHCFMRDLEGRVVRMRVEPDQELLDVLNTRPGAHLVAA